ncbi:MAG TPA: hypothetical protein VIT88_04330 [Pyrinomonadaceae bacterium]
MLISHGVFWQSPRSAAQSKSTPTPYDYYALALSSILNSARDASKVADIPQRVTLLLSAAKTLERSEPDEARRLLDAGLDNLKRWMSEDKAGWYQRHLGAALRNDILAVYARLDAEKTGSLQKEFEMEASEAEKNASATNKEKSWLSKFSDRRTIADQSAQIARSLIDADPEKALSHVVQSLQGGTVSGVLIEIVEKLIRSGNRTLLNRLQLSAGHAVATTVTLDPYDLGYASAFIQTDKEIPATARLAFVNLLIRSLQAQTKLATEAGDAEPMDPYYGRYVYMMSAINVRPIVLQGSAEQLFAFEQAMNQLAPTIPAETRTRLQAFHPETISDPRQRLNDILKDPPGKRDLRLVGLISKLLGDDSSDFDKNLDLASEAVSNFSEPDRKSAYEDRVTIARIAWLVKQEDFIQAQKYAGFISSEETRAWALLALATVAAKGDRVLGFELISNALKVLDKASPSPHKVELALSAAAMLSRHDLERAFDTLSLASRYANSSPVRVDPPKKPPVALGIDVRVGEARTTLGVFPESLGELKLNQSLSALATADWFRADLIVDQIREPSLRLQLKVQFAGTVLAQQTKARSEKARIKSPAQR